MGNKIYKGIKKKNEEILSGAELFSYAIRLSSAIANIFLGFGRGFVRLLVC